LEGLVRRVVKRAVLDTDLLHLGSVSSDKDKVQLESRMAIFYRFDDNLALCAKDMYASRVPGSAPQPPTPVDGEAVSTVIEPEHILKVIDERIPSLDGPRAHLLETLRDHIVAETIDRNPNLLARTFSPDATIGTWGSSLADHGLRGRDAILDHFTVELSEEWAAQVEYRPIVVVVDDRTIAMEGQIRRCFPGVLLAEQGFVERNDRRYLWDTTMAVFYAFDAEGRIRSIDTFASGDVWKRLRPLVEATQDG
jgi:hypothetical protein